MPFPLRLPLGLLAALAVVLTLPSAASAAKTNVAVGLGDQGTQMFSSPLYKALKLKKTRYLIAWNAASDPRRLREADAFVAAARTSGVRVLMHFTDPDTRRNRGALPSVKSYRSAVKKLVRRYKAQGVKEWGVWNEANHDSQPTSKNPARVADYFRQLRSVCKGCTIVALDLLDQAGVTRYIARFYARVPRSQRRFVKVVGIHNYSDTNRRRSRGTASIIRQTKKSDSVKTAFWLTETGGIVEFGRSFKCSEKRAASRTTYMFSLARKFRADIKRLYAYNWQGVDCDERFDAGLVKRDGSARPGYFAFKRGAKSFVR